MINRPYKCAYCGKTFAMSWALDSHKMICKERRAAKNKIPTEQRSLK